MPLVNDNSYKPLFFLINGHFETIYPTFFRKISPPCTPNTISLSTPDDDYFELDYYDNNSAKTIIISHGMEGNSKKPYVLGMARIFYENGWNVIAWNYRGCNGKMNNSIKSYHSGFTEDLEVVIKFADIQSVDKIALIGFSLGGNLTLKYLGDSQDVHPKVKAAATFSVPLDLYKGAIQISTRGNVVYSKRFLRTLKKKILGKARKFHEIKLDKLPKIKDLKSFDDYYTAPMHGFKDAMDYYQSCSAINILDKITIPTLIVNAKNDPFLPEECYPIAALKNHKYVYLQTPDRGGHVGFCTSLNGDFYWSEIRALEFFNSMI